MLLLHRNFCTGTEVVIGVVRIVPVDAQLAVVSVPVHVGHVAVRVTRARVLSASLLFTGKPFAKFPALSCSCK